MTTTRIFEVEFLHDYLLHHRLYDEMHKVFVDVGAGDGEHCSNSAFFIQNMQWKALLIDGLPSNTMACQLLYGDLPYVDCITTLVSDKIERVRFEQDPSHWSLSKMDYSSSPNTSTEKLSDILKDHVIKEVGIMSIDVEGYETKVLYDLMNNNIYPQVLIVESNWNETGYRFKNRQEHVEILEDKYKFIGAIDPNTMWIRKDLTASYGKQSFQGEQMF